MHPIEMHQPSKEFLECWSAAGRHLQARGEDALNWGLLDGRTAHPVDPPALVTDELIEITDWELHDFAVQVVRHHLEERGAEIGSSTGDPNIDPSLYAVGFDGLTPV